MRSDDVEDAREGAGLTHPGRRRSDGLEPVLLRTGLLDESELLRVLGEARRQGVPLWDVLLAEQRISEAALAEAFAQWLGVPRVDPVQAPSDPAALESVSESFMRRTHCLAHRVDERRLQLVMANPADQATLQEVERRSGRLVHAAVATRSEIRNQLDAHFGKIRRADVGAAGFAPPDAGEPAPDSSDADFDSLDDREAARLAPVVRTCNRVIQDALKAQASDIEVAPIAGGGAQVHLRIDGSTRSHMSLPAGLHRALLARLKLLAGLEVALRDVPQAGQIRANHRGKPLEIQLSSFPTSLGEGLILRFAGTPSVPTFRVLGIPDAIATALERALDKPQGMILVAGPAASGRTTTLYSMLAKRRSPQVTLATVEDPIAFHLPGVSQLQVNSRAGLSFPHCLRSTLRNDPDLILVGSMDDAETAQIAFRAAMTGHLVVGAIEAEDSIASLARLVELGIDPMLITATNPLVVAQRLARRICTRCREPHRPSSEIRRALGIDDTTTQFHRGRGCGACRHSGDSGHVGIYECLPIGPELRDAVRRRAPESELRDVARAHGLRSLRDDGIEKVHLGLTSSEELLRALPTGSGELVPCPSCTSLISGEDTTCPYCLDAVRPTCRSCDHVLEREWRVCPYCNLPLASGRQRFSPPSWTGRSRAGVASHRSRILVVGDEGDRSGSIVHALRRLPVAVDVRMAADVSEARGAIEEERPDLVILAAVLSEIDEFEVCRRLRGGEHHHAVPVLMLSAMSSETARTRGDLVGMEDHRRKPFLEKEFSARVMRLLQRSRGSGLRWDAR